MARAHMRQRRPSYFAAGRSRRKAPPIVAWRNRQMPRHAVVELRDQFPDGGVELDQREKAPIAQLRDDPTSRNLNRNLNFRFILRAPRMGRNYCGAVVMRHL